MRFLAEVRESIWCKSVNSQNLQYLSGTVTQVLQNIQDLSGTGMEVLQNLVDLSGASIEVLQNAQDQSGTGISPCKYTPVCKNSRFTVNSLGLF